MLLWSWLRNGLDALWDLDLTTQVLFCLASYSYTCEPAQRGDPFTISDLMTLCRYLFWAKTFCGNTCLYLENEPVRRH